MQEKTVDKYLNKKLRFLNIDFKIVDVLFVFCIWILSWIIRFKMVPVESPDYYGFLEKWMDEIKANHGFLSLNKEISNYTSPYMYFMCLVSELTPNSLLGLKCISYIFDYLASFVAFGIVYHITYSIRKSMLAMGLILLSPAVLIDSAYYCQCDIIYSALILYAFFYFLKNNSKYCLIFVGLAFSFKLQALFFLPFIIIMWLKNNTVKLIHFLYIPAVYIIMQIPAIMMGRNAKDILLLYFDQADYYPWGTLRYPNIYYLLDETMTNQHHMKEITNAGSYFCIALLGLVAYYMYSKHFRMTAKIQLLTIIFTIGIAVYFLPHMHERYGILIDLFLVILVVMDFKYLKLYASYSFVTILCYMPYTLGHEIVKLEYLAIFNGILLVYCGSLLYNAIKEQANDILEL